VYKWGVQVTKLMPQPWKHPKLGTYYYRKVVPPELREPLGRLLNQPNGSLTELRIPLGTKSAAEAKLKYPEAAAEADALLARAAGGAVHLTHQQVIALCGAWYGRELAEHEHEPGDLDELDAMQDHLRDVYDDGAGFGKRGKVRETVAPEVDHLLAAERLQVDDATRAAIEERMFWLMVELNKTLMQRARGDYTPDPRLQTFPEWRGANTQPKATKRPSMPFGELFNAWSKERKFAEKTAYSWRKIVGKLTVHLGHEDAAQVTDTDIIAWKDALVASKLRPTTIKNYLIVIKAFFQWAARNKRIASNPAVDVQYSPKRGPNDGRLSYSDDDAKRILLAARKEKEAHKRWVPWLCAFTGARIDEICGAMVSDVRREDKIDYIRIDPANREKGASVKNLASIRSVPLHPAIIREGFLKYVGKLPKDGPLFPDVKPDRFGKRGGNGQKTIGRWVRTKVGITDKRKAPNHSWRHRFADECRKVGIPRDMRFALDGHAGTEVGDKYGQGFTLGVLASAVRKLHSPL
jgi:integrase